LLYVILLWNAASWRHPQVGAPHGSKNVKMRNWRMPIECRTVIHCVDICTVEFVTKSLICLKWISETVVEFSGSSLQDGGYDFSPFYITALMIQVQRRVERNWTSNSKLCDNILTFAEFLCYLSHCEAAIRYSVLIEVHDLSVTTSIFILRKASNKI
jgi:hypothetical protein